jgi:signal transduction histidine kinase
MMAEQAQEAANIVEDILVAARADTDSLRLSMTPTDLSPHVEYALTLLPENERRRVEWAGGPQRLTADPSRLRQILRNLLDNAIRYGGTRVRLLAWETDLMVHIAVEDDGEPIDEPDAALMFEPYERLHDAGSDAPSGIGIGLHVSRLLARLMGGDLASYRHAGFNRFELTVPVAHHDHGGTTRAPAGTATGLGVAASSHHRQ